MSAFLKKTQGFALLEIAIALSIMGILVSFSLPLFMRASQAERYKVTREKQATIMQSLGVYVAKYGRLPCPADPDVTDLGKRGEARERCAATSLAQGHVPYQTLGLMPEVARDGFGHMMHYAIDHKLSQTSDTTLIGRGQSFCGVDGGKLVVMGEGGTQILKASKKDFVAIVLISYGDGSGKTLSPSQKDNRDANGVYASAPQKEDDFLDDIVTWHSRNNFTARYCQVVCP